MNQKNIAVATVLASVLFTGIFATSPMAAYASSDGDESETNTEQKLKQENVGSGESTNFNCGENSIDGGFIDAQLCGTVGEDGGDGGDGLWCHNPANGPPQELRNPGLGHIINAGNPGHEDDHPGACFPGET